MAPRPSAQTLLLNKDLESCSLTELKELASRLNIQSPTAATRQKLIEELRAFRSRSTSSATGADTWSAIPAIIPDASLVPLPAVIPPQAAILQAVSSSGSPSAASSSSGSLSVASSSSGSPSAISSGAVSTTTAVSALLSYDAAPGGTVRGVRDITVTLNGQTACVSLPMNLPLLTLRHGQHEFAAFDINRGGMVPETPETLVGVNRTPHPSTGSTCLYCLHDRLHGKSHINCHHRNPDCILQLRGENTSRQEHANRGASCCTIHRLKCLYMRIVIVDCCCW